MTLNTCQYKELFGNNENQTINKFNAAVRRNANLVFSETVSPKVIRKKTVFKPDMFPDLFILMK